MEAVVFEEHVRAFNLLGLPAQTEIIIGLVSVVVLSVLFLFRGEWNYTRGGFRLDALKEKSRLALEHETKQARAAVENATVALKKHRNKLNTRWLIVIIMPVVVWVGLFTGFHSIVKPLALQGHIRETYLITVSFEDAQALSEYENLTVRHPERGNIVVRLKPFENTPSLGFVLVDEDGVRVEQTNHL